MDALSAIVGGSVVLSVLYVFLHWMATGEVMFLRWPVSVKPARWPDQPVAFVAHMLVLFVAFVIGSWLLVGTLLKWLDFDSRYS